MMIINGLEFVETSMACPEQYDVFKDGKQVGYVRLRHGTLRVDYPDCGDETIFVHHPPEADGGFRDEQQRTFFLNMISLIILERIKNEQNN
jgi:hypothetical protein